MTYKEKATDIYNMIGQGQLMEAFDKYYSENVIMVEPMGSREGKVACRQYEEQFLKSVKEFHGMDVKAIGANEDAKTSFVESMMDITFQDGNRVKMEQVAVQRWEGDQIIEERFYYEHA
ncbi:MAG: nuclear transport factor 2 family protein [Bacteroidota bacterium]